ncbi:hypothetical protein TRFO_23014 [Tritrichomonas foetus]|uniref:Uncharacterized protein n=1 Tax=Tritrichomonas foetus TaxID=1144522 RepID=A0A1J4KFT2_9EUKA|nr:hypothetical protein TRFO_23014 [Tritrichomonas foetus]|eukprot:OHT08494.1 hypothetical protein TRFO_23014 [Tritrichomonas foetus]
MTTIVEQKVIESNLRGVTQFIREKNKKVLTFLGYSGGGYELPNDMLSKANEILAMFDPRTTLVTIGATHMGIGSVYKIAYELGFETIGIVTSKVNQKSFSHFCQTVFLIKDFLYGGFLKGTEKLSPTSEVMVEITDIVVALGGGEISKAEFLTAKRKNKKCAFFPFDFNHQKAITRSKRRNMPIPTNFSSVVSSVADENDHL